MKNSFCSFFSKLFLFTQKNSIIVNRRFTPDEVIFSVTGKCNLQCRHCFVTRNNTGISTIDAVAFLADCANSGITKVGFSGGEPFLRPEFIVAIVQEAVLHNMMFDRLMTNGVWYRTTRELHDTLQCIYDAGYDGKIGLSFDDFHGQTVEQICTFLDEVFAVWQCRNCVEILSVIPADRAMYPVAAFQKKLEQITAHFDGELYTVNDGLESAGTSVITDKAAASATAASAEGTLYIPVVRFYQSFRADDKNAPNNWNAPTWFRDDYCTATGNVLYVHADGSVAPCCGFANENKELIIGSVSDPVAAVIKTALNNKFVQRCFTTGLGRCRKELEKSGTVLPGKTDDMCQFCDWVCKNA